MGTKQGLYISDPRADEKVLFDIKKIKDALFYRESSTAQPICYSGISG